MRGTTTWICGVLVLGATLGAARGQDGPWPTEWRVEGTDAARTLAPGPDGGVRLALAVGREEAVVVGPAPGGAALHGGELARSPRPGGRARRACTALHPSPRA
ncbi:MAG: hypothetical protein KF878_18225 [Planctomycetes bacterium]|nr:hypothetical protein [Planctomycetota bacterium]